MANSPRVRVTIEIDDLEVFREEDRSVLERIDSAVMGRKSAADLLRSIAQDLDPIQPILGTWGDSPLRSGLGT
jgi:hypothetical protein